MLVFLSWSGHKSQIVAEGLQNWLSQVIQAVEPWLSADIDKGLRWGPEVANRLERSKVGIICLTRENLNARWILFEAGALSKTKDAYVCTLLLDCESSDVEQPLAQFQHTTTNKEDLFQLLLTINRVVNNSGEKALSETMLRKVFEINWQRLDDIFKTAREAEQQSEGRVRSERDMLQEILELLRTQDRRITRMENAEDFKSILELANAPQRSAQEQALSNKLRFWRHLLDKELAGVWVDPPKFDSSDTPLPDK